MLLLCALAAPAQRLAQRNWQNSGLTPQQWWPRATFCQLDLQKTRSLQTITSHLDTLQSIGCDALVLDLLVPPETNASPTAIAVGTLDDTDQLISELGRRKLRLLLDLPFPAEQPASKATLDRIRFWLSRGVAGFVLHKPANDLDSTAFLHQAHQLTAAALGTRILIAEPRSAASHRPATPDVQLTIERLAFPASSLRTILTASTASSILALPNELDPDATLRLEATLLLGQGAATMLPATAFILPSAKPEAKQPTFTPEQLRLWIPIGGDPSASSPQDQLAEWLHSLADLRHTNTALRTGEPTFLDRDPQNALVWILRPKGPGSPVLFACNLSGKPVHLALVAEVHALGIRASFLRTLLRSDENPAKPPPLDAIDLAPEGIFVAELR